MLTDDFLGAGPLIEQRIRDRCPEIRYVLSAADLDGVREAQQYTPAAHVLYRGYRIEQTQPEAMAILLVQTWAVVIAVRHVAQRERAARQRDLAGPLVLSALTALMGWRPSDEHSCLIPVNASHSPGFGNGFAYVPLAFTTQLKIAAGDHQ